MKGCATDQELITGVFVVNAIMQFTLPYEGHELGFGVARSAAKSIDGHPMHAALSVP